MSGGGGVCNAHDRKSVGVGKALRMTADHLGMGELPLGDVRISRIKAPRLIIRCPWGAIIGNATSHFDYNDPSGQRRVKQPEGSLQPATALARRFFGNRRSAEVDCVLLNVLEPCSGKGEHFLYLIGMLGT